MNPLDVTLNLSSGFLCLAIKSSKYVLISKAEAWGFPLNKLHSAFHVPRNRLLASLTSEDFSKLSPRLELVELSLRQILMVPGTSLEAVYFPESGWVSMLALLADGNSGEVGLVGSEGMIGLPLLLGAKTSTLEAIVQGPGKMFRIGANAFRQALEEIPALQKILLRYSLAFQEQASQTAVCNGHHALSQRLARWLLMSHDRAQNNEFAVTQEFLAMMLCVHRPGVTLAARLLQKDGLIRYVHGQMSIVDRTGLETVACECYKTVRDQFAVPYSMSS